MKPHELLNAFHTRPGLYWGGGDHPFTSWVAFTAGLQVGHDMAGREGGIKPSDLIPDDFHKFVTERFGKVFPAGGHGWMSLIRDQTSSEQEAFDLFFKLRGEYGQMKGTAETPSKREQSDAWPAVGFVG